MHCHVSAVTASPGVQLTRIVSRSIALISIPSNKLDGHHLRQSKVICAAQASIARGLAYAPYADMLWMETSTPDLGEAQEFADAIHAKFPGKLLAYNCSPSFNWKSHLDDATIAEFQARALTFWRAAAGASCVPGLLASSACAFQWDGALGAAH